VPSLSHFDFVIHLEPAVVNRYLDHVTFEEEMLEQSVHRVTKGKSETKSKYRNFALQDTPSVQAGLNVGREFFLLLESLYLDTMRLYYDPIGGIVIGGLFNPSLSKPRPFRVGLGFNSRPVDDESKDVILNHKDVIAEIERLGKGLVERVEWQKK
jgi:U3 small nucleolar RNA-associated protein 22